MKRLINLLRDNRYFLLFILIFAYVQSVYARITVRSEINLYTFTPEAALASLLSATVLFLILLFFLRQQQKKSPINTGKMLRTFVVALTVYVVFLQLCGLLISAFFGTIERNFNARTLPLTLFSNLLNGCIYGSFFLAYYYYRHAKKHQQQVAQYDRAISESKINQLRAQLNPHFLFNNLNVLDQLIEVDKNKASDFLNEFAELYRYVLQASDKKILSVREELDFANTYFNMVQPKYGKAYSMQINGGSRSGFLAPLTMQLLIENAVQHNLGTGEKPIVITINVNENFIVVKNTINRKRNFKSTSGRALKNLEEQYKLLSKKPINIRESGDEFVVTIPVIYKSEI